LQENLNLLVYSYKDSSRLRYILNVILNEILGISYNLTHSTQHLKDFTGPAINYSDKPFNKKSLWIIPHSILYEDKLVSQNIKVSEWNNLKIFFKTSSESDWPFDIFAASFYLISRYEEYFPFKSDKYGRFEAYESLAFKNGFLEEPIVNIWAAKLGETLQDLFTDLAFPVKKFEYISTIDVDNAWAYLHKGLPRTAGAFVKSLLRLDFPDFIRRFRVLSGYDADPYYVFDYLEEQERKYGFDSVYFFLTGRYGRYDTNISLKKDAFRNLILHKLKNSDIGIHPSYSSNKKSGVLEQEVKQFSSIINRPIKKSRQHFLILRFPETYKRLIKAGITEDYSLGYSSAPGFRAGICTPFRFYDLSQEKETGLTLVPFHVMDVTLREYIRLTPDEAIEKIKDIVSKIKSVNGTFVSLWHNESLSEKKHWKDWRRVYEEMIKGMGTGQRPFRALSPPHAVPHKLRYLKHNEIDKGKWDNCISRSVNEFIYAHSWYLDIVSPGWDALIEGDYEAVMPLTWKRKFGIYYLYPPYFAQQLGVFSTGQISEGMVQEFIKRIPGKFRFIQICLNESNPISTASSGVNNNFNYKLDISGPYSEIHDSYSRNCKRNIKKAVNAQLTIDENITAVKFAEFVKANLGDKLTELNKRNYITLKKVLEASLENGTGKIYRVLTRDNKLCAAGSFLLTSKRCIFSVCASSAEGRSSHAMYFLVDHVIKNNSDRNRIFDFSGSNIKGVAYFNSTFGAKPVEYPYIYRNNLPRIIRFLK
jgi:hypothetical protein